MYFKLQALYMEKKQRAPNKKLAMYNTGDKVHLKQLEFHKCTKRNRWVFGGNRSGKSECGAVEAVWLARGIHPFRENKDNVFGWVVSLSTQVQRDVAQAKVLSYLNKNWIEDVIMLSGKKENMESGIIDTIMYDVIKILEGARSFKVHRLTLFGLTKNRLKIFTMSVVCVYSIGAVIFLGQ